MSNKKASDLNPCNPHNYYLDLEKLDEVILQNKKASDLNPCNPHNYYLDREKLDEVILSNKKARVNTELVTTGRSEFVQIC